MSDAQAIESHKILCELLDDIVETVEKRQGHPLLGSTRPLHDRFVMLHGLWQAILVVHSPGFGHINSAYPVGRYVGPGEDGRLPGIIAALDNILYAHGTIERFFPAADPDCAEKVIDFVRSIFRKDTWKYTQ